ncbi:MAG TPA: ABC transporter permease [Anaerolineales bacterium]|nr:ABC transporter permease [Anaerolineales bacterium]
MNTERFGYVVRQLMRRPTSIAGIVLLLAFILIAIFAPVLAPPENGKDPYSIPHTGYRPEPSAPSAEHPFGTTERQYDVFYGVVWGTRTAFRVGLIITGAALAIGLVVGSLAAYYGGWVDNLLMRLVEIVQAFPFLLATLTLAAVLRGRMGSGLTAGIAALIAFGWPAYSRLIRGDILSVRARDFNLAARAVGAKDGRILTRHILPNAIFPTLVYASMDIGSYVLSFAALSFLGLGADVGYADWGQMISFARNWIPSLATYPHIVLYPGMAILLFVLAWNLLGDAFRDIIDPRLRGSR